MRQPHKSLTQRIRGLKKTGAFLVLSCLVVIGTTAPVIRADSFDDQISNLKAQNAQGQAELGSLQAQASSYQDAINQLQTQINAIEAQIADNQARQASLTQQIQEAEDKIAHERQVLGEDLKTMYVDGQMSTIEELATSNNLSDYVDKQTYREAVQSKIQETLKEIAALQAQLQAQKAQVEELLTAEHKQQDEISAAEAQQQQMLAYNQSQQDSYTAQLQANNSRISQLRAQQAAYYAAYSRRGGIYTYGSSGNGGYPDVWAYAAQDSMVDSWGMYNRECVSYAAWKEASMGKYVPYGLGNAADWSWRAPQYGIPVSKVPAVGTIAQWDANAGLSPLGHVAYVEAVNDDGSIEVSQYNWVPGGFNRMHVPAYIVANLNFIYFR
jgi:surface antigen